MRFPLEVGIVIAIAGFLFIAYETLLPGDEVAAQNPQWCLVCGYVGGVSFLLNVILFIPLGFGIRLAGTARSRTIATPAARLALLVPEVFRLAVEGLACRHGWVAAIREQERTDGGRDASPAGGF